MLKRVFVENTHLILLKKLELEPAFYNRCRNFILKQYILSTIQTILLEMISIYSTKYFFLIIDNKMNDIKIKVIKLDVTIKHHNELNWNVFCPFSYQKVHNFLKTTKWVIQHEKCFAGPLIYIIKEGIKDKWIMRQLPLYFLKLFGFLYLFSSM